MKLNKRGLSGTLSVVLIIFLVIALFASVYLIVSRLLRDSEQSTRIKITTTDIELERSLLIYEKNNGKLQINIKGEAEDIKMIKAVVLGKESSGSYLIYDVPKEGTPKTYVLNVSMIGNINEILIYPVVYTNVGSRTVSSVLTKGNGNINEIIISPSSQNEQTDYYSSNELELTLQEIDTSLPVIDPEQFKEGESGSCISDWTCEDWSKCFAIYSLDNLIDDVIILNGEQTRLCIDRNSCLEYLIDRRECDTGAFVTVKKSEIGNTQFLEIFDENQNLVSKLEFIKGEHSVLNIDIPIV